MSGTCKRLNILYVGTLPPHPGGAAISCVQLLDGFVEQGHRVRAMAPLTSEEHTAANAFADRYPGIEITWYPVPFFEVSPNLPPPDYFLKMERDQIRKICTHLIAKERPDGMIIGRESFARHVPDLAESYDLPCILMVRGNPTHGILDGTYPDELARCLIEQYRKVDLIVTNANHMTDGLRRIGLENVKTILNAVDIEHFSPRPKDPALLQKLNIKNREVVVAHISKLTAIKRPLDILKSAAETLKQDPRLIYLIVGDGPGRASFKEACKQMNIVDRFRFAGWIEYSRMPDYINLADMVIMPSEAEALSRVYLETQACARLLIASDIPSACEIIEDGQTGLLFRKANIADLTAKTLFAAAHPHIRTDIGHQARIRVKTHALKVAVTEYVATLHDVILKNPYTCIKD